MFWFLIVALVSYLIGSVSFAVVVSRAMNLSDPRSYGSGNPGATNVLRSGNKTAAVLTLLGDGLKGLAAVWLAAMFTRSMMPDLPEESLIAIALGSLGVFAGHLFPIFHGFKGGKGVATAAGILFAINGWLGLACLATWLIIAVFFRYSSLAALATAVFAPFYYTLLFGFTPIGAALVLIGVGLIWRHRSNITKLLAGTESRIGKKS